MLIPPLKKYQKRSTPRTKSAAVIPPVLPPLTISDVVDVYFDGPSGQLTVRLDVAAGYVLVEPTEIDPTQWTAVFNGILYQGADLSFEGENAITISFGDYGGSGASNSLNYVAGPSEIADTQGRVLGAVENYPI